MPMQEGEPMPMPTSELAEPMTLPAVLSAFADDGFGQSMKLTEHGLMRCTACGLAFDPHTTHVLSQRNLADAAEPGDTIVVIGTECPACHTRGAAVLHYGPVAPPAEVEALAEIGATPA
jgi:hypothetical protein